MKQQMVYVVRDLMTCEYVGVYPNYPAARRGLADYIEDKMEGYELDELAMESPFESKRQLLDAMREDDWADEVLEMAVDAVEYFG